MNIRMYNCNFGDCFRLEYPDSGNPLYVDFGIHYLSMRKEKRFERYDQIINDMPNRAIDFVLTHYHFDHYEGLLYMLNQKMQNIIYNFYLPDIWKINCSVKVVALILYHDLLSKSMLDGISIFDLLISICNIKGSVHFVGTGDFIQKRYSVLWPDRDSIKPLPIPLPNEIQNLAENLVEIVLEMEGQSNNEGNTIILQRLRALKQQYIEIKHVINFDKKLNCKLSTWENNISIVFHSCKSIGEKKVLFCGDVPKKYWKNIIPTVIEKLGQEKNYDVIKVPHHGTKRYFYDFGELSSNKTTYLIPNGNHKKWRKYDGYSIIANKNKAHVVCSNNLYCAACNENICKCFHSIIIENSGLFYIDV